MGANICSHTHRPTLCAFKKLALGVFPEESEKCWQTGGGRDDDGGGGNGPKTIISQVTRGDLTAIKVHLTFSLSTANQ